MYISSLFNLISMQTIKSIGTHVSFTTSISIPVLHGLTFFFPKERKSTLCQPKVEWDNLPKIVLEWNNWMPNGKVMICEHKSIWIIEYQYESIWISKLMLRKIKALRDHNHTLGSRLSSRCIMLLLCETALSKWKGNAISVLCSIENLEMLCNDLDIFCGLKENYRSIKAQNFMVSKFCQQSGTLSLPLSFIYIIFTFYAVSVE